MATTKNTITLMVRRSLADLFHEQACRRFDELISQGKQKQAVSMAYLSGVFLAVDGNQNSGIYKAVKDELGQNGRSAHREINKILRSLNIAP